MKRSLRIAIVVTATAVMMSGAAASVAAVNSAITANATQTTVVADGALPAIDLAADQTSTPAALTPAAPQDFSVPAIDKALRSVTRHVASLNNAAQAASTAAPVQVQATTSVASAPVVAATHETSGERESRNEDNHEGAGQDD
jgi:hypothetical protein